MATFTAVKNRGGGRVRSAVSLAMSAKRKRRCGRDSGW